MFLSDDKMNICESSNNNAHSLSQHKTLLHYIFRCDDIFKILKTIHIQFPHSSLKMLSCYAYMLLFLVSFSTFRRLFKWIYRNNFHIFKSVVIVYQPAERDSTKYTNFLRNTQPVWGEIRFHLENNETAQFNHDTINH